MIEDKKITHKGMILEIREENLKDRLQELDKAITSTKADSKHTEADIEYLEGKRYMILEILGGRPKEMKESDIELHYEYRYDSVRGYIHYVILYKDGVKWSTFINTNKKELLEVAKDSKDNITKEQLRTLDRVMSKRKKVLIDSSGGAIDYKKGLDHQLSFGQK